MKRVISAIFLIIVAVIICSFSNISTVSKSYEMKAELEKIGSLISDGKTDEAEKQLLQAEAMWSKAENLLSFIVDADKIEEMNIGFSMIRAHLKDKNKEHALERLRECELLLEEIAANEKLDIKNIM